MKIIDSVLITVLILSTEILHTEAQCYIVPTESEDCDGAKAEECTNCFCYDKMFHCCSVGQTVVDVPEGCKRKTVGCNEIAVKIEDENEECVDNVSFVLK